MYIYRALIGHKFSIGGFICHDLGEIVTYAYRFTFTRVINTKLHTAL